METIAHLVADARAGLLAAPVIEGDVVSLLDEREVAYTTWSGWLALDAHELELGANHEHTRERVKVVPRDEQVGIARAGALIIS
jgi:ferredoxin--NADP+ reductase